MSDFAETTLERVVERVGSTFYGKYRGIVTDVNDPDNLCRIRARVPSLLEVEKTGWAMPAAPFAGSGHGMVMLPEIDSGVWIEFEAGDLDKPIWSGGWWANGERPKPHDTTVRMFVSEAGNKLIFDDGSDDVTIVHHGGAEIKIKAGEIVMTVGGCEVKIDNTTISLNRGLIKVGIAGVSLVNGSMVFGVPPP
jgi:uncharacterized protein involved in type VI secretion and phage assembly